MGCHSLLQEIFLTQGSNPPLLHWQADSLRLSHLESPSHSSGGTTPGCCLDVPKKDEPPLPTAGSSLFPTGAPRDPSQGNYLQGSHLGRPRLGHCLSNIPRGKPCTLTPVRSTCHRFESGAGDNENSFWQLPWWRPHPVSSRYQ